MCDYKRFKSNNLEAILMIDSHTKIHLKCYVLFCCCFLLHISNKLLLLHTDSFCFSNIKCYTATKWMLLSFVHNSFTCFFLSFFVLSSLKTFLLINHLKYRNLRYKIVTFKSINCSFIYIVAWMMSLYFICHSINGIRIGFWALCVKY